MNATRIDGKACAARLRQRLKGMVAAIKTQYGRAPTLAVVLVGDDPASHVYVRNKTRQTEEVGMVSIKHQLAADIAQDALIDIVRTLNTDPNVDGILVQLPLPAHLDESAVIEQIDPAKDVDGLTEANAGRLVLGKPGLRPCTPTGCVILAREALSGVTGGDLTGKSCVIIGRSILVGKPAAMLFLEQNCTVTIAHSRTDDLPALCRTADILVAAVGRPQMVKANWVKPGAIIIDVGINRIAAPERGPNETRLVGDVDFNEAGTIAGAITPVPGGVGPMTIACLLRNTVLAACARMDLPPPKDI